MSDKSKRSVTFRDHNERSRPKSEGAEISKPPVVSHASKPVSSRRSTGQISEKSSKLRTSIGSTSSRTMQLKRSQPKQTVKSVVRNCDSSRPAYVCIIKTHESKASTSTQTVAENNSRSTASTPPVPTQHTTLKTARQIRRVSDLDLEEAYKSVEGISLKDENIDRKVARAALNVPSDERLYSDLVSVDVAESQLGPRIADLRLHRPREKQDREPRLQDFCREDNQREECWPSFPPVCIPFDPVPMYRGKEVVQRANKWHLKTKQLLQFGEHSG